MSRYEGVWLILFIRKKRPPVAPESMPEQWLEALPNRMVHQLRFLIEADRLKTVLRGNRIADGTRRENTAEHSWHVVLFAVILAEWSAEPIDVGRVVSMLILHDIVEIDAGDTSIFDEKGTDDQAEREAIAADRLFNLLPAPQCAAIRALWVEFEAAITAEARFAKSIDRLQPIILNHMVRGGTRLDHNVHEARERRLTGRIANGSPALWHAAEAVFKEAVDGGWMRPSPKESQQSNP